MWPETLTPAPTPQQATSAGVVEVDAEEATPDSPHVDLPLFDKCAAEDPCTPIGTILRGYRKEAGLTQGELAQRAGLSMSLISKIEVSGRAVSSDTLAKLARALELSDATQLRLLYLMDPHLRWLQRPPAQRRSPTPRELSVLLSNPHPACFLEPGFSVIIAANNAFHRTFPGLRTGDSMVEWQLLNPWARGLLVDWRLETHWWVRAARESLDGFIPSSRVEAIKARLRGAEEFDDMWNTRVPECYLQREIVRLRRAFDDDVEGVYEMYIRLSTDDSPWQHYALTPL
ncbi:helix-turn-helix domain-containing protein [Nocardia asiatica]|uniref:helix-turn-helix domain-containing protein n=1 Tax=Nocardia asiatica TaxID=209252 RepID=UPI00031A80ED|nr:helix-turn-helix transcriptional regulator [Nocardia asiatica]